MIVTPEEMQRTLDELAWPLRGDGEPELAWAQRATTGLVRLAEREIEKPDKEVDEGVMDAIWALAWMLEQVVFKVERDLHNHTEKAIAFRRRCCAEEMRA